MKLDKARPGQRLAIETILSRTQAGKNKTSVVQPCGYGKRGTIIASGMGLIDMGLVCCNLVVNPNDFLRKQFVRQKKFEPELVRFGLLDPNRPIKYRALDWAKPGTDFAANGELFLSTTIQLILQWTNVFVDWIESMYNRHKLPVGLFLDECQFHASGNKWGTAVYSMWDAGAVLFPFTATPMRDDNQIPIGFDAKLIESNPVTIKVPRRMPDPGGNQVRQVKVEIYSGTSSRYDLVPDVEWGFDQAWAEGVLCHISLQTVDANLRVLDPTGDHDVDRLLSDLNEEETRKILPKIVRHPDFIRECCKVFLHWLSRYRALYSDVTGIIYTGNDQLSDERFNEHAEQVNEILVELGSRYKIVIATSANEKAGKGVSGAKVLEGFTDEDNQNGDIAILKQMAGLGLDDSRIKIELDLSVMRTPAGQIQRDMRIARPHHRLLTAVKVCPKDCLSLAIYERHIREPGGATVNDLELVGDYEVDETTKEKKRVVFKSAFPSDTVDTKSNVIGMQDIPIVNRILEIFPSLVRELTIPELAAKGRLLMDPLSNPVDDGSAINTGDQITDLKKGIHEVSRMVINCVFAREQGHAYNASAEDKAAYQEVCKRVWRESCRRAGVEYDDYNKIDDLAILERLRDAWEDMVQRDVA